MMRLQAEGLKVALHAALGDARLGCYGAQTPVRRTILGLVVQGLLDELRDPLIIDAAWPALTQVAVKSGNPLFYETCTPLADGRLAEA